MKAAFLSDIHVRESNLLTHMEILNQVAEQIKDRNPDIILVGGDLVEQVSHKATPAERNALLSFFLKFECPVIVIRGNHDFPGDHDFKNHLLNDITYVSEPTCIVSKDKSWGVLCLPWIDRSVFEIGTDYGASVRKLYRKAIIDMQMEVDHAFVLGHIAAMGAFLREGQPVVPTKDPMIDLDVLLKDADFEVVFLGHYHAPQELDAPVPAFYAGSTFAREYGEPGPKRWILWDSIRGAESVEIQQKYKLVFDASNEERIEVRGGLLDGEGGVIEDILQKLDKNFVSSVRVSATIDECDVVEARARVGRIIEKIKEMGIEVAPPQIHIERRVRVREGAAAIAKAVELREKVQAFFTQLDPMPNSDTQRRALEFLERYERELE